ncbi:MAG: DUF3783 domain-containing protein [Spirochaetes bacterium]|nr:DUF3783 domain-containing protein [Spirochaetota bacterium]
MDQLGIMLYGYEKTDAYIIKQAIEKILGREVELISSSRKESEIVEIIFSDELYDTFEDKEIKILMFLGFDDSEINLTLEKFPAANKVTRPIFCGLTENNIKWTLKQLLEHLIEERNYWNNKNKKQDAL